MQQISQQNKISRHFHCIIILLISGLPSISYAEGLGTLLHQVERKAPQLHLASSKADASAAGIMMAKSQYWGHAEVFGQSTHYNNDRLVNPISYPPVLSRSLFDKNTYGVGAAFTLPVDLNGRIAAKVHAQEHLSQAAQQSVAQTRLALFAQTVSLYRGLQRLDGVKQAHLAHLKALQAHRKLSAASVRVGRVAAVELSRIEAEIQSVEGLLAGLSGDEVRLRASLAALLNQEVFADAMEQLNIAPSAISSPNTSDEPLKKRPDLLAADSMIRVENENLKNTHGEWLPTLSLRAEAMRNQGYTANGQNTWSIRAQLSWQFWDGGRRLANMDRAMANKEVIRQQYKSTLNQARAELASAKAAWQSASKQYEAATSGLKSAIETERIQSDRFHYGRISTVDFLDAEALLARARAEHISALVNWWLADDQLHLVQGIEPSAYTSSKEK